MAGFYLKVLTGNHIGAEIPIAHGEYIVGKDFECDIVLTDDSLSENEFKIIIKEDNTIFVESLSEKPIVIANNIANLDAKLHYYDVFTTNSVFFAVGPDNTTWPKLQIPETNNNINLDDNIDDIKDSADSSAKKDSQEENNDEIDNTLTKDQDNTDKDTVKEKKSANNQKKTAFLKIATTSIILLIITILFLTNRYDGNISNIENKTNILETAKQIKNELNIKHIKFKKATNDLLLITGYCQSYTQERQLYRKLNKSNIKFNTKIYIMNDIFEKAKLELNTVSSENLQLEMDNTPGNLTLKGYTKTIDEKNKVIALLKDKVEGLITIIDQVETFDTRLSILNNIIGQQGLGSNIQVIAHSNQEIVLKGRLLEENQVYKIKKLINEFNTNYNNNPLIKLETTYAGQFIQIEEESQENIKLNIKSINVGKIPYIILQDNSKYLVGSIINNRYKIEGISIDYLLLNSNGKKTTYYLGGTKTNEKKE
jgi:type III secretion system YscD/HrpQ family protein